MSETDVQRRESWSVVELPERVDARGRLGIVESGRDVPFEIARMFYIHAVPADARRGGHAHRTLEQLMIPIAGGFMVTLDDGRARQCIPLNDPARGLYLPPMTWCELGDFAPGSVCLVLASAHFDEDDYYRDYDSFRAAVRSDDP